MRSVPVVAVKPSGQLGCAFVRGVVGTGIGPLAQARLDEALSLAVSFGRVRLGSDVFEGELLAGFGEVLREIARAVVGHNTLDLDPQTCVIGHRRFEEGKALVFLSSLMTWTEGDTRCVVDADMDELPADAEMAVDHARLKAPHQPSRPHWEQPIEAPHLDRSMSFRFDRACRSLRASTGLLVVNRCKITTIST